MNDSTSTRTAPLARIAQIARAAQRHDVAGTRAPIDLYIVETTRRRIVEERIYYAVRAESPDDAAARFETLDASPIQTDTIADGTGPERITAVTRAALTPDPGPTPRPLARRRAPAL